MCLTEYSLKPYIPIFWTYFIFGGFNNLKFKYDDVDCNQLYSTWQPLIGQPADMKSATDLYGQSSKNYWLGLFILACTFSDEENDCWYFGAPQNRYSSLVILRLHYVPWLHLGRQDKFEISLGNSFIMSRKIKVTRACFVLCVFLDQCISIIAT